MNDAVAQAQAQAQDQAQAQALGLSDAEAAARLAANGPNRLPSAPSPSFAALVVRQVRAPLVLVLVAAAAASAALGRVAESVAIMVIVVLNSVIGGSQEYRSDRAVAALNDLTAPTATVRRSGRSQTIPAADVVVGDIIELRAGDQVPADGVLVEASSLAVDEALLTGESLPADKSVTGGTGGEAVHSVALGDRVGDVFMGTMVTRGVGLAEVRATGGATALGSIAESLATETRPPLEGELRAVATWASIVAIVLGVGVTIVAFFRNQSDPDRLAEAITTGVALAVAAIPEGLAAVVTSALALGGQRMAKRGAIVRRLSAIETLGSASVICSDKTGTLTTGNLAVAGHHPAQAIDRLQLAGLRCNEARDGIGDPIDVALATWAAAINPTLVGVQVEIEPFDAQTRQMSAVHRPPNGAPIVTVKGAPEAVFGRCTPTRELAELLAASENFAERGLRVLAFAEGSSDRLDVGDLDAVGLVAFHDPLRSTTAEAVAACHRAGIRVVMVTGDHAVTAGRIAEQAGLPNATVVTGPELAAMPPQQRAECLRGADVVARVNPELKVELVAAHREAGAIVAMTGDGVNDAPALRAADIGVALSSGSDVARQASGLVITDGDLGRIIDAIGEGRSIRRNLRAVLSYMLGGNLAGIGVFACALFLLPQLTLPLLAVQLLWMNLLTDGLPAIALGVDRPARSPLLDPPRALSDGLLDRPTRMLIVQRSLIIALLTLGSALLAEHNGATPEQVRSQLFLSLIAARLVLAFISRSSRWTFEAGWYRSRPLLVAIGGSLLLQVPALVWSPLRRILQLTSIPSQAWLATVAVALGTVIACDLLRATLRLRRAGLVRSTD